MERHLDPLDAETLATLESLGESTGSDLLHELAKLFIESDLLEKMRAAWAAEGPAQLGDLAHRLKGSSSAIGALRLSSLCQRIEERCARGDEPGQEDLDSLAQEYVRVVTSLQEL